MSGNELERKLEEVIPVTNGDDLFEVNEVLRGNTFGILESEGSTEDKIARLLALLPVAFQVVDEARDTIMRLREENERLLRGQIGDTDD